MSTEPGDFLWWRVVVDINVLINAALSPHHLDMVFLSLFLIK